MNPDLNRYEAQINVPEIGFAGQKIIAASKVLVIGAGGLGSPALLYLSALGIGKIGIVDFDTVSLNNLNRQILYAESDQGKLKVESAKEKLLKQNSKLEIETYNLKFTDENASSIVNGYDMVLDCCDNYETRYTIDSICFSLKKPWIYAAVSGFEGQISVFNYQTNARYSDLYSNKTIFQAIAGCAEQGVTGSTCAFAASLQINELIKVLLKRKDACEGELLAFDLIRLKIRKFKLHIGELNTKQF